MASTEIDPGALCPGCRRTYTVTGGDFDPNWTVHPGEFWQEYLNALHLDLQSAASRTGVSVWYLNDVLHGSRLPSAEVTVAFAKMLDIEPRFLWQIVANYQLDKALGKKVI